MRRLLPLIVFVVLTLVLLFKLTSVPPLLNQDEASFANASASIAANLKDDQGHFLPLYFDTLGEIHDWKNPLIVYWTAIFIKLFGFSVFTTRLSMVVLGLIADYFVYQTVRLLFPHHRFIALSAAALLVFSPLFLFQARVVIDPISLVATLSAQIYFYVKYLQNRQNKFLYLSAFFAGLSIYSYSPGRLYGPFYFLLSLLCLKSRSLLSAIKSLIVLFILTLPLLFWQFIIAPGVVTNRFQKMLFPLNSINLFINLPTNYLRYFDPSFLFGTGDSDPLHSTLRAGVFPLICLLLGAIGLFVLVKRRDAIAKFLLLAFITYPLGVSVLQESYRAVRIINILPIFVLICAFGLDFCLSQKYKYKKIILTIFLLLFIIPESLFLYDFYFKYNQRWAFDWRYRFPLAVQTEHLVQASLSRPGCQSYVDSQIWFIQDNIKYFENVHGKTNIKIASDFNIASQSGVLFLTDQVRHPDRLPQTLKQESEFAGVCILESSTQ